jgi:type VII secretion-associated protein (TIGR03931 family)
VTRVAVQVGAAWLRVAVDEPRPRLLAELPASEAGAVLAELFEGPVDELIVVHPARIRPVLPAGVARVVRAVPSAVAAAALAEVPTEHVVIVDVGYGAAEVALVRAGEVVAVRRVAVGGARLDAVVRDLLPGPGAASEPTEAHRVREALSLLPTVRTGGATGAVLDADDLRAALAAPLSAVVDAVRAVLAGAGPGPLPPVLLIGGVARTPLLAELVDAAGINAVRVAERPDAAAVLGALRLPPDTAGPEVDVSAPVVKSSSVGSWLPPVVRARHRGRRALLGALAAAAVTGLLAAGAALPPAGPDPGAAPPTGDLVQYGYAVRLPAGWAHTGGLPERRRSLLTPLGAPDGSDLISVERTPLGYDADAEPRRARAELRTTFVTAVAAGAPLSGFDDRARFAGRPVVAYREAGGGEAGDVDWYVVLDGDAQLSVGCRHTGPGAAAVGSACATVVASLRRTG